ncbi:MAG TPA: nucleotide sugar dehydrogenase [Polyangiales bacterium]|jgi:UDP-N-acetyl-D-glucosamine dehydrogenase|nr:nucleotide sugar dehydrogenase [Polyangiales bacterium]
MNHKSALLTKLENRTAVIGVVGLGYVGLPLALAYASRGFTARGFDIDRVKIQSLGRGESYIEHIPASDIEHQVSAGRLVPSDDFELLRECDAILICVPTPLTEARDPDLSYVISTTRAIARTLSPGKLVVLESTTYPGTTEEVVKPILEETGLVSGKDFFLAFSPEREDPGNATYTTVTIPKVVGGCGTDAGDVAECLYAQAMSKVVRVSNTATAEATKITENVFRAVNIALVNELKVVYERMGIDIWEVLDAAATKPFGFMRFNPGPGWGGHCIPLDPFYLSWKAREHDVDTKFIELAGEINRAMSEYVVTRVQRALNDRGRAVKGSAIMLLGLAYKKDVGDTRESPAFPIAKQLLALGASLTYHDPYLKELPETRVWAGRQPLKFVPLTPEQLGRQDAVVIVTDHTSVDYAAVLKYAGLIIDSRGVYRGAHEKVVRA